MGASGSASHAGAGYAVRLSDQFIQVAGDTAYELGVEHGQFTLVGLPVTADLRVTNIYRRESGGWKIVHHHTDAVQSMIDALSRPATSLSIVILPRGERAENLEHEFFIPSTSVLYGSTRVQPS